MAVFAKVVESGSLSAAARALGVSLASVSRQLAALEEKLGARLLSRTTRRLSLTEGGRAYYARCKRILGDVEEAEAEVSQFQASPSGRIVVSASMLFGSTFLAPVLSGFLDRYPRVSVELPLTDRFVNLVEEGIDVAVRVGGLADSSLVARRIGAFRRVVCAAPRYLRQHGVPREPADVARHDCLIFSMLAEADRWRFSHGGRDLTIAVTGRLRSNHQDALLRAALDSAGIMLAPSWLIRDQVATGRLRVVLQEFEPEPTPIHILYPHARLLSAKVRALIDYLAGQWREEDFGFGRTRTKRRGGR